MNKQQRGLSLIEALVAMAVMAVGMLGVLGMQATLRSNGDISKQRSEAVRVGQAAMETQRGYSVLPTTAGTVAFDDIAPQLSTVVAQASADSNTTFRSEIRVAAAFAPGAAASSALLAPHRSVVVEVNWRDRNDELQRITLPSIVAGVATELSAALVVPGVGSAAQSPGGRNAAIPLGAVDRQDGTSTFVPPGGANDGVVWTFSNTTGLITQICTTANNCNAFVGQLLSGYVRFATSVAFPTATHSRLPPDTTALPGVGVSVDLTAPTTRTVACYGDATTNVAYVEYFCALPISTGAPRAWSGRAYVTGLALASAVSDPTATAYRVCRYTSTRSNSVTTPPLPNEAHPYDHAVVMTPLTNQNFLVIKAGDGTAAYTCPDDTSLDGRTMDHQPAS